MTMNYYKECTYVWTMNYYKECTYVWTINYYKECIITNWPYKIRYALLLVATMGTDGKSALCSIQYSLNS